MQEMQETRVRSLGQEGPLKESMATHSNSLAWRILWTEEPGGLRFTGSQRVGHDWSDLARRLSVTCVAALQAACGKESWLIVCYTFGSQKRTKISRCSGNSHWFCCHWQFGGTLKKQLINQLCMRVKSFQSCPTLCDPMDSSPSTSSVRGVLQARILECAAMPSSRGSSWPRG